MQDRIYRFQIKRQLRPGVFDAHDTVADAPVTLYAWTPPTAERAQARAALAVVAETMEAEVFSADDGLYLVAANPDQARKALKHLHGARLFPGVEAEAPPAPKPPPPPPPKPAAPPRPPTSTPPFQPVRTGPGRPIATPPGPAQRRPAVVAGPRSPRHPMLWAFLLFCLSVVGLSAYEASRTRSEAAALVGPTLTLEPARATAGERVRLDWSTSGYARVQLDGQTVGSAGNRVLTATASRTFHLVATTAGGEMRVADAHLAVLPGRAHRAKPSAATP